MFSTIKRSKGASLVEELVYIGLFAMLLLAVVNATIILSATYRNVQAVRAVEVSAITSMDRMIRETRDATSVNAAQTTWNSSPGALMLDSTNASGTSSTVRFYVSNGQIMVDENGTTIGPLTGSNVTVSSLIFRSISTSTSDAVKIEMTLSSSSTVSVTKNFYDTAVLRGSY